MTKFLAQDKYPAYKNMLNRQTHVPGQDFYPVVVKNIFTDNELKDLQETYDNFPADQIKVQSYSAHASIYPNLKNKEDIIKRVEKLASEAVGEELVVLDIEGARYSREFGWEAKLGPHYDARPVEMYVLDFHVKSNEDWKLIFECDEFTFGDNEGLLFSGTGTVHWRDPIRIKDDSRIDLLFFWLQHKNPRPISNEHRKNMKEREAFFLSNINPVSPLSKDQWWKPIKISEIAEKHPHYQKISAEILNPVIQNEIYMHPIFNQEKEIIYSSCKIKNNEIVSVNLDEEMTKKISEKMLHVYTESSIKFFDSHVIRLSDINDNSSKIFKKIKEDQDFVSIMFPLSEDGEINIDIDGKEFVIKSGFCVTFSENNQNVIVKSINAPIDLLVCSFTINKKDSQ